MFLLIPSHQGRPGDDPIFALNREATQRAAAGDKVINATVGALLDDAGKLCVLPSAAKAIREVDAQEWAAYAPIAGTPQFLNAVMDDFFSSEPELRKSAVAVATPGGSGALRHAIGNYLEHGQALLATSAYWGPYATLADETERTLALFNMFNDAGGLDVAALDAKVAQLLADQGRVLLFLNDPCHNPTGYSMTDDEWKTVVSTLLSHASKGPITLLVDTAYFAFNPKDPRAFLAHLRPLLGKVGLLFAWSASKTYTHYGLRVGALIACVPDDKERAATDAALTYSCRGTWSNCNRGGLAAITRLLTDQALRTSCDAEREGLKKLLADRVVAFNEAAKPKGLRYPRYEGGFFVTLFDDQAQQKALRMKEQGVFVVPSKGAMRVALCGVAAKDVPRLVDVLAS
jgi:aromatic-amino-acid transaminase